MERGLREPSMETTCKIINYPDDQDWLRVRNDFLTSQRKETDKVPSSNLKLKYLASGHSPIYGLSYTWQWNDLPYFVSVHICRHSIGIHHVVSSQRNDIQKQYDRRKAPQDSPVNHRCVANAATIINISQKRLCLTASTETRTAWGLFLSELEKVSPEIVKLCVRPCVFRCGICPELFSNCKWNTTSQFGKELLEYKKLFEKK
jgi:hypothetical protein